MWQGWRLVGIRKSFRSGKKLVAEFEHEGGRRRHVHFGASGYSDYTIHGDIRRRERFFDRHSKNENWSDPLSAGALARWILWNKRTLEASVLDYRRRFNL